MVPAVGAAPLVPAMAGPRSANSATPIRGRQRALAVIPTNWPWYLRPWGKAILTTVQIIFLVIFLIPRYMIQVRMKGGDEAVQLTRYLRLAVIWTVIMLGSALALAAAAIQLALA
jgi:hypothetical protein